jgi:hypothetical protein
VGGGGGGGIDWEDIGGEGVGKSGWVGGWMGRWMGGWMNERDERVLCYIFLALGTFLGFQKSFTTR